MELIGELGAIPPDRQQGGATATGVTTQAMSWVQTRNRGRLNRPLFLCPTRITPPSLGNADQIRQGVFHGVNGWRQGCRHRAPKDGFMAC